MTAVGDSIKTHILKHSVENNIRSKSNWWWFKVHPGSWQLGAGLGPPPVQTSYLAVGESHLGGR